MADNPFDEFDAKSNPFDEFDQDKDIAWSDVPGEAIANLGPSAARFAQSVVYPFLNPVETLTALRDLGIGLGSKAAGWVVEQDPEEKAKREAAANAVGQFLVDRYGSVDAFKKTLATDPVGALADISTVFTAGGAAAARAPGIVGTAGKAASRVGRAVDPLSAAVRGTAAAAKGTGRLAREAVGITTGTGAQAFGKAFEAGQANNAALRDAMRGNRPIEEVVDIARNAIKQIRSERSAAYTANTAQLRSGKTNVSLKPVDAAIDKMEADLVRNGFAVDRGALGKVNEIKEALDEFRKNALAQGRPITAYDLDGFKQRIGAIRESTEFGTNARRVVGNIYNSVKKTIQKQVPDYGRAMKVYEAQSKQLDEMQRSLSLGDKASVDTTLRKLLSSQRSNVNTNFGRRTQLVEDLATYEPELPNLIAGHTLSELSPRGLARVPTAMTAIYGAANLDPTAMATLPFVSPRAMGEVTYKAGQAVGGAQKLADATGASSIPLNAVTAFTRGARALGGTTQASTLDDQRPLTEEEQQALARELFGYANRSAY